MGAACDSSFSRSSVHQKINNNKMNTKLLLLLKNLNYTIIMGNYYIYIYRIRPN